MRAPVAPDPYDVGAPPDWWAQSRRGWHALFAVVVVACLWVLRQDEEPGWSFAVLGALAAWYLLTGARAVHDASAGRRSPWPYLVGAGALTAALAYADPNTLILLFALYPQIFALLDTYRRAAFAAGLLSLAVVVVLAAQHGWTGAALLNASLQGVVNYAFALVIGGIIEVLVREMNRRGELLAQVEQARAERDVAQHQAGALAERERLAREIHDTLAQGFTSILMLAQAADAAVGDTDMVRARLASVERTARENLAEARALVAALEPVALQESTLVEAVDRLVTRCAADLGIEGRFEVRGEPTALDSHRQVVLLRAAQEGLANVRKHARAHHVAVSLTYGADGGTTLQVRDDGDGPAADAVAGSGLRGMRARAEAVGGTVQLHPPGDGAGTELEVALP